MTEPETSEYISKPIGELLRDLRTDPTSKDHQESKGALLAAVAKQIVDSIDRHERSATVLSGRLLWLNIILGAFTIAGTVLTIISMIKWQP